MKQGERPVFTATAALFLIGHSGLEQDRRRHKYTARPPDGAKKNISRKGTKIAKKNVVLLQIFAPLAPLREIIQTSVLYDVTGIAAKLLEKLSSSCDPVIQIGASLTV